MKNAKEMQLDKMLDCLRSAGLTPEQLAQAEDYIAGDGVCPNYGIVNKLDAKVKVNSAQQREVENYLQKLINSKRMEEFGKLFNLLFQVYGVSMRCMFPRYLFGTYATKIELYNFVPRAGIVALMAEMRTRDVYRINAQSINEIIDAAREPEVIKRAFELADKQYCNGRIMLLAAYFKMQKNTFSGITDIASEDSGSGVKNLVEQMNKAFEPTPQYSQNNLGVQTSSQPVQATVSGILGGLARLFGKKDQGTGKIQQSVQPVTPSPAITKKKTLNPDDKALFDEYVHLIITNIRSVFEGNVPNSDVAKIIEYINNDKSTKTPRPKEICDIVNRYKINEYFDALFLGCAMANYRMSYKLTNLIKVCAYGSNFDRVLDVMKNTRGVGSISDQVFDWREEFMLDTTALICWCAKNDMKLALPKFAEKYSDEYITALKKVDLNSYSRMIDVLGKIAPKLYEEKYKSVVADSGDDKRRMIAGELTKAIEGRLKTEDVEAVKSYLING
ncbi:MAG: hypothetical protein J6A59_12105, partial [Lachnospiraceae bacterium]|nr:hypothetical protein [Lachnospiraceae bacterium]